ncbi:MAG: AAA family ATPase [Bacteroidota bacterium]
MCFANEYHAGRYLDNLVQEYRRLYAALSPVSANDNPADSSNILCEVVVRQNVTIGDIVDVFQSKMYRGRIAIFHYGGHADGYQLLLEGKNGENQAAHGAGLVSILSKQDSLKLVFLNGCSTQKMAQDLVARGVPAVIGTATAIADQVALNLSERFYKGLAQGLTLSGAWEAAKDEVRTAMDSPSNYRSLYLEEVETVPNRFPWDIEYKDDAAREVYANWNLPDVASQPLFGLPDIAGKHQLPPSPFLFLKPYEDQHAEIFFGRSYYIRELYLKIVEPSSPPIILLYGESGAGKSSLLDAGLRPRLDAARKVTQPDEGAFEVHYQRRNGEIGLVGTLLEMLSYTLEAEQAEETKTPKADPNAAKIEEIEQLIDQLEGEDRQSLKSFLERYKAVKSVQGVQQKKRNLYEDGSLKAHTGAQLRAAWANIEATTGKRLIIILDQVEEVFARPHPDMPNELEDFLQIMKEIWATPDDEDTAPIRGRIILGYREEFNARIEARIKDFALSRTTVFLEHLQRKDILDIFSGLQSEVVRQNYNVQIEPNLPERVADDLLKGRTNTGPGQSPVAPVLQLLLTKMWNKAYKENSHEPHFTIAAYNAVQNQGREMEEFFYEQLDKVDEWDADVVDTGLVLDVLQYHVTDLGTSGRRHMDDIRNRYRHLPEVYEDRPTIIFDLVEKLKEVFLLVDNSRGFTSLPHDTLAPIVMREYNRSDKLGQRSTRILDTKLPDFVQAEDKQKSRVRLDDNDLEVVEGGVLGMRALSDTEYQLLEISKVEREKRLRLRRQLIQGGLVTGVIILLLALVAGSLSVNMVTQLRKSAVSHAHEESQELLGITITDKNKDTIGDLREGLASFAYTRDEVKRTDIIDQLYGLAYEDLAKEFYFDDEKPAAYSIRIRSESRIQSLDYQSKVGVLSSFSDGTARVYPLSEKPSPKFQVAPKEPERAKTTRTDLRFTADGQHIELTQFTRNLDGTDYGKMAVYLVDGELQPAPLIPIYIQHEEPEMLEYYSEDQADLDYLQYSDANNQMLLGLYDCLAGTFTDYRGEVYRGGEVEKMSYRYPDYRYLNGLIDSTIDLDELRGIRLWDRPKQQITQAGLAEFRTQLTDLGFDEEQQFRMTGGYEQAGDSAITCKRTLLTFTPSSHFQLRSLTGEILNIDSVNTGLFYFRMLNDQHFLSLEPDAEGTSNHALVSRIDDQTPIQEIQHEEPILEIAITGDKQHFVSFSENQAKVSTFLGEEVHEIQLEGMRHQLSSEDSRLIVYNKSELVFWSGGWDGEEKRFAIGNPQSMEIQSARFIPDDEPHLAIGIKRTADAGPEDRDSVLYWSIREAKVKHAFALRKDYSLRNMKLSSSGDELAAWVIDKPDSKKGKPEEKLVFLTREGVLKLRGESDVEPTKEEQILFSRGARYILLYNKKEDLVKVYNLSGELVNTYELKQGFQLGFNKRSGITADEAYMFGHNANNALYWTLAPEQVAAIEDWATDEEHTLDFYAKQEFGLISILDQIPGHDDTNRNLSIGLLILGLLYLIMRAANFIYEAASQKNYQKAGLYGGIFALFSFLLLLMWADTSQEETRLTLLNFTLLSALVLSVSDVVQKIRQSASLGSLILPGLATLVFTGGTIFFDWREFAKDGEIASDALNISIFMMVVFSLFLLMPVYVSQKRREQNRMAGYYGWLLPIVAIGAFIFWVVAYILVEEIDAPYPELLLLLLMLIGGSWMAIHQIKRYRSQGKRLSILVYGLLAVGLLCLIPSAYSIDIRILANIILLGTISLLLIGIETARQKAHRKGFQLISAGLVGLVGTFVSALMEMEEGLFYDVEGWLYTLFLFLLPVFLYGVRYFLRRSEKKQETGQSPWPTRLAGVGTGILLLLLAYGLDSQLSDPYEEYEYFDEDDEYYYDEATDTYYYYEEEDISGESSEEAATEATDESAGEPQPEGSLFDAGASDPTVPSPSPPVDIETQIANLFAAEEATRTTALSNLQNSVSNDPELISELFSYNYEQPEESEGIMNTLRLLQRLPDEVLISQEGTVLEYLDWVARLGFESNGMDRLVAEIRARVAG